MTNILGVDFSGAKTNNRTEVTKAIWLDGVLKVEAYEPLPRKLPFVHEALQKRILNLPHDAIVALDFPFSVPQPFALELAPCASTMPNVWCAAVEKIKEFHIFKNLRDSFVKSHGEMMRRGDVHFGGPFSPLHEFNPSMLQMTFHGMKMLHNLWKEGCRVPPLSHQTHKGQILLETMPGVLLRSFALPARNYKTENKTNGANPRKKREEILEGLEDPQCKSGIKIQISDETRRQCLSNADCLDSLVAAIGAAMWAKDKSQFLHPRKSIDTKEEFQAAQLEGWIYAPKRRE